VKTLLKYHSAANLNKQPDNSWLLDASGARGFNHGWRPVPSTTTVFVSEQVLDVAGLAMEEETLFFDGITTQEGGIGAGIEGDAGDSFVTFDIVSTIPIDIDNNYSRILFYGVGYPAGPPINFEHIPFALRTRYTLDLDTAAAFAFKASTEQHGSMEPTASDKLYVYRLLFIYDQSTNATSVSVPPVRVLFAITAQEEATYSYMMRLKRSYDLQQSPDVD
jgi:hypothetical protein